MSSPSWVEQFEAQGFCVHDGLVLPSELKSLQEAAARATARAREGKWQHGIRTAASPFPPYEQDPTKDVWAVHMLCHPDMGEPVFLDWYGSDAVRAACAALLHVQPGEMQMEHINFLCNPQKQSFGLPWHRDIIPNSAFPEEELAGLKSTCAAVVQWNTALVEDRCLLVVPGSHLRQRTEEERRASVPGPDLANGGMGKLPNEVRVVLQPGETVFYHPDLLHRAEYDHTVLRQTLHCSIGVGIGDVGVKRAAGLSFVLGREKMKSLTGAKFIDSLSGRPALKEMHRLLMLSLDKAKEQGLVPATDEEDPRNQAFKDLVDTAQQQE